MSVPMWNIQHKRRKLRNMTAVEFKIYAKNVIVFRNRIIKYLLSSLAGFNLNSGSVLIQ